MSAFRVWIEPTRKGNFRVRSRDQHGTFRAPYCIEKNESATIDGKLLTGRTLAKAYVKLLEDRFHKSELGDADLSQKVEDLLEEFIQDRRTDNFSPKTLYHYEASFRAFMRDIKPALLADVTNEKIRAWKTAMTKQKLSVHTITNQLSDLRTWLNWLKEREHIRVSPFGEKMMPMKKELEPKFYTRSEFVALDEALARIDHPTRVLCNLAHSAGLRKKEGLGVTWEDISWEPEGAELLLRKEVVKGGKHSRSVPLDPGILEILGSRSTGRLVSGRNEWQINHYFKRARKLSGINPELHIHGLRHTFAKNLLQSGKQNLAGVQKLMGHSSIISTMVYAQFEKSYLRESVNRAYEQRMFEEGILKRAKEA